MPRYLLAIDFRGGIVDTPMSEWKPQEIAAHLDYYRARNWSAAASWWSRPC